MDDYGAPDTAHSPLGTEDLDLLKQTVPFSGEDERYLRMAGDMFEDQIEDVLDVWYGFVGSSAPEPLLFQPRWRGRRLPRASARAVNTRHLPPTLRPGMTLGRSW